MRRTFEWADGLRALAALAWWAGAAALATDLAQRWEVISEHGRDGVLVLPLAVVCGAALLARRRIASDAIASGLALPAAQVAWSESGAWQSTQQGVARFATMSLVAGSCLALGALALAHREGGASRRVALSGFAIAWLTPLVIATTVWGSRMPGHVVGAPHLFGAAAAAVLALVDLQRGKTRALAWIGLMAAAVMTSPSWGAVPCGCWECPGPMEWPMYALFDLARTLGIGGPTSALRPMQLVLSPPGLFTLALAPWALPVWRYLRSGSQPRP